MAAARVGETGASTEPARGGRHFAKMIPHDGQSLASSGASVEQRGQIMDGCQRNVIFFRKAPTTKLIGPYVIARSHSVGNATKQPPLPTTKPARQ